MKTKIIYLLVIAGTIIAAAFFTFFGFTGGGSPRYQQHLEQPSAQELGECEVCKGEAKLCTHLPVIRIETNGQKIPGKSIHDKKGTLIGYETGDNGETEIPVTIETVDKQGVYHHDDDPATVKAKAMLRVRGNSSRAFDKSGYRIELYENNDPLDGLRLPLLGMDPGKEWSLHGPFLDKTLIRNYMWMNISAAVMGDAPDVRFCEVLIDGKYQGLYVLMETVTEGAGRVDLTDYDPGDSICSYIVRIGGGLNPEKTIDTFSFYTSRLEPGKEVEILYPPREQQTERVKQYVEADYNEVEKLLFSAQMARNDGSYRKLVDVDSFVNYYVLQEFLAVNDVFSESTYFYHDVRGKLHIGPVWDYNNVLDNFFLPIPAEGFLLDQRGWFGQMMMDDYFVERVIGRWRELRSGVLSEEYLNSYIDDTVKWLGSAVERNFKVWGYSFDSSKLSSLERRRPKRGETDSTNNAQKIAELNPSSFEQAVDWMRDYMNRRGRWIDRNIDTLRQYCQESKNAVHIVD